MTAPAGEMSAPGVIRYWGSHFKSSRQAEWWLNLLSPLLASGWRCCLVLERLPEDRSWTAALESAGVELVCLPRPRKQIDGECVRAVRELCRRFRADVFHCENIHTSPMIGAWRAGVPVRLWQKHSMFVHYEECRQPSLKERLALSTRLTSLLATKVICVSESVAEEAVCFGAARAKIAVRNNPRPARSADRGPDRTAARASFGFSDADYVIVAVGHTVPVKGWDVLLKAFGEVARAVPSARLLLAGSHTAPVEVACHQQLLALCAEQQVRDRVTFTGHLPDVRAVLRAADVFVLPSRSEGNSYSLLEALDAGLPCVATTVGAAPQMIKDGVNGHLVPRLDAARLAKALIHLGDTSRRSKFAAAVTVPSSVPTFEEYARQLRRDYERWLGRPVSAARPVAPSAA